MPHEIRYTRTKDGASIAYSVVGSGQPIVSMPLLPFTTLDGGGEPTPLRLQAQTQATLVDFDVRGFGLSEQGRYDYSAETLCADLVAVIAALGNPRVHLISNSLSAMAAIRFAARYPHLLDRLVLVAPVARGPHFWDQGRTQAFRALRETDWETYKDVMGTTYDRFPHGFGMIGRLTFKGIREQASKAFMDAFMNEDVTADLSAIRAPTLVLCLRSWAFIPVDVAKEIAAAIPDASLAIVDTVAPDSDEVQVPVADFLGLDVHLDRRVDAPAGAVGGRFKTIMFTDLEGSTTLTQRLGDADAQQVVRAHDEIVRAALTARGGHEIKHTGDGIMAAFDSASKAIDSAIDIQRRVSAERLAARVRIGINAGEPVAEGDDLFGTAVQLARRICDHGEGGDILVANVVRELAAGKGYAFADRGEAVLKGFEDATRIFAVSWSE